MDVETVLHEAKDTMRIEKVFGKPIEKNGLTLIPTATVQGGGGGGSGEGIAADGQGSGQGVGFGVNARASGMYVIDGTQVRWQPAVDVNKIIMGAQVVAIVALLVARAFAKSRRS